MGEFDFLNGNGNKSDKKPSGNVEETKNKNQSVAEMTAKKIISEAAQMTISTRTDKQLDNYLARERQKNKYDPRPDIEEDHYIWVELLKVAEKTNQDAYGLLHGLRCAGCRLKIVKNPKKRKKVLKLDLDKSKELLEMFIAKDELEKVKDTGQKQIPMFGMDLKELARKRKERKRLAKKKIELEEEAAKYIKKEWLRPKIKELAEVFEAIQPLLDKIDKKVSNLSILQMNNYFADIEYRKKRGRS